MELWCWCCLPATCVLLLAPLAQEPQQVGRSFCPLVGHLVVCVCTAKHQILARSAGTTRSGKRKSALHSSCTRKVQCALRLCCWRPSLWPFKKVLWRCCRPKHTPRDHHMMRHTSGNRKSVRRSLWLHRLASCDELRHCSSSCIASCCCAPSRGCHGGAVDPSTAPETTMMRY